MFLGSKFIYFLIHSVIYLFWSFSVCVHDTYVYRARETQRSSPVLSRITAYRVHWGGVSHWTCNSLVIAGWITRSSKDYQISAPQLWDYSPKPPCLSCYTVLGIWTQVLMLASILPTESFPQPYLSALRWGFIGLSLASSLLTQPKMTRVLLSLTVSTFKMQGLKECTTRVLNSHLTDTTARLQSMYDLSSEGNKDSEKPSSRVTAFQGPSAFWFFSPTASSTLGTYTSLFPASTVLVSRGSHDLLSWFIWVCPQMSPSCSIPLSATFCPFILASPSCLFKIALFIA